MQKTTILSRERYNMEELKAIEARLESRGLVDHQQAHLAAALIKIKYDMLNMGYAAQELNNCKCEKV